MKSKNDFQPVNKNEWLVPRSEKCFKCKQEFQLTFSFKQQNYSLKNFWGYWTNKEEDEGKFICSSCLRSLYLNRRQEFLMTVKDLKKRNHLASYVSRNII
jgi:hypothetical protein